MRRVTEWKHCGAIEIKMESGSGYIVETIQKTPAEARYSAVDIWHQKSHD